MTEENVDEAAVKFTLEELRRLRDQIDQRVKQLESVLQDLQTAPKALPPRVAAMVPSSVVGNEATSDLVNRLDELPWRRAKSKKCYWVRGDEAPWEVRNLLRRSKNELVAGSHRYVILDNDNILRFERNEE